MNWPFFRVGHGGVVVYQYTRRKFAKIPKNNQNSSKYTQNILYNWNSKKVIYRIPVFKLHIPCNQKPWPTPIFPADMSTFTYLISYAQSVHLIFFPWLNCELTYKSLSIFVFRLNRNYWLNILLIIFYEMRRIRDNW